MEEEIIMKRVFVGDIRFTEEDKEAINKVLDSGRISEGKMVREFEKEFASYIGTKYAVALSSGTAALISGLTSLTHHSHFEVEKGSKIITSPLTYISTCNSIVLSGFEPVFVDVDPDFFGITIESIEDAINPEECYAILPVHLMGFPCNMDGLKIAANNHGLILLEDSAQAHGSSYNGKKTGSMGLWGAFSFYIAHNIQAGEMGAITTDDPEIYRLVKKLKSNGRMCDCPVCSRHQGKCPRLIVDDENDFDPRFTHDIIGYNFKLMEFQAALGLNQLRKVDWIIQKRQKNVKYLNEKLNKFSSVFQLPRYSTEVSYLAYPIVIKDPKIITRKKLRKELEEKGIETRPLFGCIPTQQPAYSYLKEEYKDKLPVANYLGKNGFYIGCHQYLEQEDLDYVTDIFDSIMKGL